MRLGLQIPDFTWPGGAAEVGPILTRVAVAAEDAGLASLWVMDHFFQIDMIGPPEREMLESYTTLSYLAALTHRLRLGAMVTGVTYRHPGILVKTVTTLDVLSGGRACLGIGAAWNEQEHRGLGVPYPPDAERLERLEETLQIAQRMWSGDDSPFDGRHYQLERPLNSPAALSRPRPPILVGGGGERKTLRLVAQYADACNIYEMSAPRITHKLQVLREHCTRLGRDYEQIERTTLGRLSLSGTAHDGGRKGSQSVDQAVDRFARLAALGVDHAIVSLADVHDESVFELVGEVASQLASITPAGRSAP